MRALGRRSTCAWRVWEEGNVTLLHFDTYGIEVLMHEMLMQSDHRCARQRGCARLSVCVLHHCRTFLLLHLLSPRCRPAAPSRRPPQDV
jgi:hypothetical protein